MVENGLYVIKRELLEIISRLGGDCDLVNGDKRPVFCCLKDSKSEEILSMEFRKPNYFPQHITALRNFLIEELNSESNLGQEK